MKSTVQQKGMAGPIFALMLVPILALTLLVGVEIAGVLSMIRSLETSLDRIGVLVGRHLPDLAAATGAVSHEMVKLRQSAGKRCYSINHSIEVIEGGMLINAECEYVPRLLGNLGMEGAHWRFRARSHVVRAASDLMLIIDSSAYLAPQDSRDWGAEPASTYFREKYGDGDEAGQRTRKCNNPVIRAIKRFALAVYPKFLNARGTRIGIAFIPGNARALIGNGGGSPYLTVLKSLDNPLISENSYSGISGSDHECRQVAEFEFDNPQLFALPEFAMADSSGIGIQIWGKAVCDNTSQLSGNTWNSLMEGFRYGAGGSAPTDIFGNDRDLNIVVLAGDVPRRGGERFPWAGGINSGERDEFLRVIASGRNINLVYLIYAPAGIDTGISSIDERAVSFARALKGINGEEYGDAVKGQFRSLVAVYRDERIFFSEGLDLVRRNAGRIVLRRLQ